MPVSNTNAEYDQFAPLWRTVRDCIAGQAAVKAAGATYLPQFIPHDEDRYSQYKQRAVFLGVTNRTRNSLVGAAFRKEPELDVPTQMEFIREDLDGNGNSLTQIARSVVSNLTGVGRHGLLADYPSAESGLSLEDVRNRNLRPYVKEYSAENIINWRVENGVLTLVVLREMVDKPVDEFSYKAVYQYRVLRLTDGTYTQQLYDENNDPITEALEPRKADGSRWDVIPFVIAGSVNNDPNCDYVTLYDLAELNIAHYRNSADYEEGVFIHGQPMLHIDTGDMNADAWNTLNPNGVSVGARRGIVTNQGGSANLLQAQPNSAAFEALKHKENQMLQIGARLVEAGGANETAEAVRAKTAAEHSVLDTIVGNAQEALEAALEWVAMFMGADPEQVTLDLNRDFFDHNPDANMLAQMMGLESVGIISKEVILGYLRRTGVVDSELTDEEILDQIDEAGIEPASTMPRSNLLDNVG